MKFKYNDGGRKKAGYKGQDNDCVVRAIAIVLEIPYKDVYDALYNPRGVYIETYDKYLVERGYRYKRFRRKELPPGRLIIRIDRHIYAVLDGVVNDTHNWNQKIFGYYEKV